MPMEVTLGVGSLADTATINTSMFQMSEVTIYSWESRLCINLYLMPAL